MKRSIQRRLEAREAHQHRRVSEGNEQPKVTEEKIKDLEIRNRASIKDRLIGRPRGPRFQEPVKSVVVELVEKCVELISGRHVRIRRNNTER